jgi:hypothetical protein
LYSIDRGGREHISDTKVHLGLVGGNGDDTINVGVMLPSSNCVIDDVILELVDKEGNILSTTSRGQPDAVNDPIYNIPITSGARIVSSNEGTTNLAVQVHWFFTAGNAVRYRLHYFFKGNDCDNDRQPDFNGKETKGAQALQTIITESEGAAAPITDSSLINAANIFGTFSSNGRSIILPKGTKDSKEIEKNYICKEGR